MLDLVAAHRDLTLEQLLGRARPGKLGKVRQEAIWLAHKVTGAGITQLGRLFLRDHTTILYHLKTADARRDIDPAFRQRLEEELTRMLADGTFVRGTKGPAERVATRAARSAEIRGARVAEPAAPEPVEPTPTGPPPKAPNERGDRPCGGLWTRAQLDAQNARFAAAMRASLQDLRQ